MKTKLVIPIIKYNFDTKSKTRKVGLVFKYYLIYGIQI